MSPRSFLARESKRETTRPKGRFALWLIVLQLALGPLILTGQASAEGPTACLAPGSDSSSLAPALRAMVAGPQTAFVASRWTQTATNPGPMPKGSPVTVTWGVVPDGTMIRASGVGDVDSASNLRARLDGLYGSEAVWRPIIQSAIESWSATSGLFFEHEPNDDGAEITPSAMIDPGVLLLRPDIRIGGHFIDGSQAVVAYAYDPLRGDIVLDSSDDFYSDTSRGSRNLKNAVAHEVGHALGLRHTCPEVGEKLMEPVLPLTFDGPQHDDLLGVSENYGDHLEDDDTSVLASDLGIAPGNTGWVLDLSIDSSIDEDWVVLPPVPNLTVTVTVAPYGEIYAYKDSNFSDGVCGAGPSPIIDTQLSQDLSFEIIGSDGLSVIRSVDDVGAGENEIVSNLLVPGGGFIRVLGDGGAETQIYDILVPEPGALPAAAAALCTLAALHARARRRGEVLSRPSRPRRAP